MAKDKLSCEVCGTKNDVMKICTGCRSVYYCSKECQKAGWQKHKFLCGPDPAPSTQRPSTAPKEKALSAASMAPLQSGVRVHPDGSYEQYSLGKLVSRNGEDLRETDKMQQLGGRETRAMPCTDCTGNGYRQETVCGIVRREFCAACNGEGCFVVDAKTGKKIVV